MLWQTEASPSSQIPTHRADNRAKQPADRPRESRRMWETALVAVTVAAPLCLVWGFEFFPTVDGPAHVHLAYAMAEALRGDAFYGGLVELNSKFNPNMTVQAVLVALMTVVPPFVAEKIWLSIYFVGFAAAGTYTLTGINRNAVCLLPLLMMCSITFALGFGFYNFAFSTVIFLAWFGFWWRHRERMTLRIVLAHAVFAAVACVTHIFALVLSLLGIGAATAGVLVQQILRDRSDLKACVANVWRRFVSHALPPLIGSIPEIAAALYFLLLRFGKQTAEGAAKLGTVTSDKLTHFLVGSSLAPYDQSELVPAIVFLLVTIVLLGVFLRFGDKTKERLPMAACFTVFLVLYFIMPDQWFVRWMPPRFQPLVFVALLLWLAALMPTALQWTHWKAVAITGMLILSVATLLRSEIFADLNDYYREFASASPHIAENSSLIALRLHKEMDGKPFPALRSVFVQAGSRLATERHAVDLKNFQGQSSDHPIQFRPGIAATRPLGGDSAITAQPPTIDLMAYERETGRTIDYVLTYGYPAAVADSDALERLESQIRANYRLDFISKPTGFVHLYSRLPSGPSGGQEQGR